MSGKPVRRVQSRGDSAYEGGSSRSSLSRSPSSSSLSRQSSTARSPSSSSLSRQSSTGSTLSRQSSLRKDDEFHNAREWQEHPLFMGRTDRRVKQNYSKVKWESVLGTYSPEKNYMYYKRVYNAKLRLARTPANRERLQSAWRAMKTNLSHSKKGLNRKLQTTTDPRKREQLKSKFREGTLATGRVTRAMPVLDEKSLPKALGDAYDFINRQTVKRAGKSLTRELQVQLISRWDSIVSDISKSSSFVRIASTTVAGFAAAGATCVLAPFIGSGLLVGAAAFAASTGASVAVQRNPGAVARPLTSALTGGARAGSKVLGSLPSQNPFVQKLTSKISKIAAKCVPNVVASVVQAFANLMLENYAGVKLDAAGVLQLLKKHSGTVRAFLEGKDVSLRGLAVDLPSVLPKDQVRALMKKVSQTTGIVSAPAAPADRRPRSGKKV